MDETHTGLFRRGRIIGIHAKQDAIFRCGYAFRSRRQVSVAGEP